MKINNTEALKILKISTDSSTIIEKITEEITDSEVIKKGKRFIFLTFLYICLILKNILFFYYIKKYITFYAC